MANKSQFQAIKGTRDLLPPETALWNQVEQTARQVFATFHFGEIRTPIFEPTELFARAVGGDTDIVGKEMYSFVEGRVVETQQNLEELEGAVEAAWQRGEVYHSAENQERVRRVHDLCKEIVSLAGSATAVFKDRFASLLR